MLENLHLFGSGSNCKELCVRVLAQNAVILEEMEKNDAGILVFGRYFSLYYVLLL